MPKPSSIAVVATLVVGASLKLLWPAAKGAEFTMEPTTIRPNVRIAFLRGPQGVAIELVDRNAA